MGGAEPGDALLCDKVGLPFSPAHPSPQTPPEGPSTCVMRPSAGSPSGPGVPPDARSPSLAALQALAVLLHPAPDQLYDTNVLPHLMGARAGPGAQREHLPRASVSHLKMGLMSPRP